MQSKLPQSNTTGMKYINKNDYNDGCAGNLLVKGVLHIFPYV